MTRTHQGAEVIVCMPALGESVEEGTITRWLKRPGDHIEQEEPLLEVATDKVDTEVPSPCSGTLTRLLADENDIVAVGAELAMITVDSGMGSSPADAIAQTDVPSQRPPAATDSLAGGAFSPTPTVPPSPDTTEVTPEKLPRIRRTIAARMVESLKVSAQLTSVIEVDLHNVARLRDAHKAAFHARTGTKLSYLPFFAKAAIAALPDHPMLNASLNADVTHVTYHRACHLGIAVDGPKGLMVPVIRHAEQLSLTLIAQSITKLADKVRSSAISPDELTGGTFTITNTGSRGALFDTPIINQPQTGILGTGAVVERLVPLRDDGGLRIEVRPMAYLSLTYDHRLVDGADAARFLGDVKHRLEAGFSEADLEN
jgi:2-oxoglutarate dehydrogenase E2 component (dihydrolipoamide succinyltransferase)